MIEALKPYVSFAMLVFITVDLMLVGFALLAYIERTEGKDGGKK